MGSVRSDDFWIGGASIRVSELSACGTASTRRHYGNDDQKPSDYRYECIKHSGNIGDKNSAARCARHCFAVRRHKFCDNHGSNFCNELSYPVGHRRKNQRDFHKFQWIRLHMAVIAWGGKYSIDGGWFGKSIVQDERADNATSYCHIKRNTNSE